jgi:hypothetical protein
LSIVNEPFEPGEVVGWLDRPDWPRVRLRSVDREANEFEGEWVTQPGSLLRRRLEEVCRLTPAYEAWEAAYLAAAREPRLAFLRTADDANAQAALQDAMLRHPDQFEAVRREHPLATVSEQRRQRSRPDVESFFEQMDSLIPSWAVIDDAGTDDWHYLDQPLDYLRASALATHLVALAMEGRMDQVRVALDVVEKTLGAADGYTKGLMAGGLLEGLQDEGLRTKGRVRLVDIRALLGPKSTEVWDALLRYWQDHPSEARRRLPPGSLPEAP